VKALRLHAVGDLRLHDEADPAAARGESLLRVTAVGLCGSDRHWFEDGGIGDAALGRPLVLGHEIVGVLEDASRRGERVALDPADPCRHCEICLRGLGHLCPNLRFAGHGDADGGLRERMSWPTHLLHRLPETIRDAEATLLEPLGIAIHALDLGGARPGMSAGVYGCGPIGLLLVRLLRAVGCGPIIATDPLAHRVEAARAGGATHASSPLDPGAEERIEVDVAFEVAGEDASLADAVRDVRPGGRVVLVGIPSDDRSSFGASTARRKGLTLLLCRRMTASDLPRAIRLVDTGRIDLAGLVTARHPLPDAAAAFDALVHRRGLKVVVEPAARG
jgi:L-iditol 2-dehydrogenase